MHVDFDPVKVEWSSLLESGDGEQFGGYNVFRGVPFQRGSGLGSVFRSFLRYLIPIGKQIGLAVGHEGLRTGNRVLSSVLEGKDLKDTLVSESKAGIKNLLDKASMVFGLHLSPDSYLKIGIDCPDNHPNPKNLHTSKHR